MSAGPRRYLVSERSARRRQASPTGKQDQEVTVRTTSEFVRGVDFIGIPTRDLARASEFYGETLGLPRSVYVEDRHFSEYETGNLTLSVYNAEKMGIPHNVSPNPVALHVDDVAAARKTLEERGVTFHGETI